MRDTGNYGLVYSIVIPYMCRYFPVRDGNAPSEWLIYPAEDFATFQLAPLGDAGTTLQTMALMNQGGTVSGNFRIGLAGRDPISAHFKLSQILADPPTNLADVLGDPSRSDPAGQQYIYRLDRPEKPAQRQNGAAGPGKGPEHYAEAPHLIPRLTGEEAGGKC